MTKYICECDRGKPHRCTHESDGRAPVVRCVDGDESCNWRAVEDQKPEHPDQIQEGAWVYITPDNSEPFYGKVYSLYLGGQGVWVKLNGRFVIAAFSMDKVRPARCRPWTYKEAIGKTVFWKFDNSKKEIASMIDRADDEGNVYVVGYGELKAKKLMMEERFSQSDGLPCGVLEHKNEEGEWVK